MPERLLTILRIFFRDDEVPEISIPLERHLEEEFYTLNSEREVVLPDGHSIMVYAEASLRNLDKPDVSLSIIEGDKSVDLRCCGGVIVSYTTATGRDVLLQIGTGAWE